MHEEENRMFVSDTWDMAIARIVFVWWMKSRGLWAGYKKHLNSMPSYKEAAWDRPEELIDFLGNCGYEYVKAYIPWCHYCEQELGRLIENEKYEYLKSH